MCYWCALTNVDFIQVLHQLSTQSLAEKEWKDSKEKFSSLWFSLLIWNPPHSGFMPPQLKYTKVFCAWHLQEYRTNLVKAPSQLGNLWFLFHLALVLLLSSHQLFCVKISCPCFTQIMIFFHPISLFEQKKVSFDDFFMTT